jgi:hypothetical protein
MKILIACEMSGRVRDAFRAKGHNAWSCDLVDSEGDNGYHMKMDVLNPAILNNHWDMLIAFPPCTYVCSSGLHWNTRRPERQIETEKAIAFAKALLDCDIKKIALENPIGCLSTRIRKPDQIIQPWMFGHPESKATCLWLKGLPKLQPSNVLPLPKSGRWSNQTASGQNKLTPSDTRSTDRSRTYQGIADAMANQWSK